MMQPSRMISTKDIPARFLESAMMVGKIPFTALQKDTRISYTLYIPPSHYNPDPSLQSSRGSADLHPQYLLPTLPLVINIHGSGRNSEKCRDRLIAFADSERVAILAPLFPAGLDGPTDLDSYKILASRTLRSDLVLFQILEEVATKWPGIQTKKFFLMGFSGGGQFVHRFSYLYPENVLGLSVGAPGQATFLDESLVWPDGIQDVSKLFGRDVDKTKLSQIGEIQLVVGGEDNVIHGGDEFWEWLAMMRKKQSKSDPGSKSEGEEKNEDSKPAPDRKGRLDTLVDLQEAWKLHGIRSNLETVPGIAHSAGGVHVAVEEFLCPLVRRFWEHNFTS